MYYSRYMACVQEQMECGQIGHSTLLPIVHSDGLDEWLDEEKGKLKRLEQKRREISRSQPPPP